MTQNATDIELRLRITAQTTALAYLIGNVEARFKFSYARSMSHSFIEKRGVRRCVVPAHVMRKRHEVNE